MPYIEIETEDLEQVDSRILPFRALPSANRPALEGVLVEPSPEGLLWAATDSYRMGSLHRGRSDLDHRVVLDASIIDFAAQAADRGGVDTVRFRVDPSATTITLDLPGVTVARPLRRLDYPDVSKVLDDVPQQNPVVVHLRSEHLRAALFATCTFNESTDEERGIVALRSTPDGHLRVIARWSDIPDTSADVDATGDGPVDTVVNASFLVDLLDATDARELTLLVGAPTEPLRVRADDGFRCLLMPIRLGQGDLERKIAEVLGVEDRDLLVEDGGVIPLDVEGHGIAVSLLPSNDPFRRGSTVRFAVEVLAGTHPTPELLAEINDLNSSVLNCRVVHLGKAVRVYAENLLETLDHDEIVATCNELARHASTFGPLLGAVHSSTHPGAPPTTNRRRQ